MRSSAVISGTSRRSAVPAIMRSKGSGQCREPARLANVFPDYRLDSQSRKVRDPVVPLLERKGVLDPVSLQKHRQLEETYHRNVDAIALLFGAPKNSTQARLIREALPLRKKIKGWVSVT